MNVFPSRTLIMPVALAILSGQLMALNLVQNGSFTLSNFAANSEFSPAYLSTATSVTGWTATGASSYNIYFFAGTSTTVSAANEWGSTAEKLWAFTNASRDGGNFVMLDGDPNIAAPITQMINNLTINQTYTLTFEWAAAQVQSKTGSTTEQVKFSLGSDVFTTAVVSNPSNGFTEAANNQWFLVSQAFKATATSELLSFMAIGTPVGLPPVVLLDGISLTLNTPEPGTLGMMAIAFGGLIGLTKYRRRS